MLLFLMVEGISPRARIQKLLLTAVNRLKQGAVPAKVRESYEQELAVARESNLSVAILRRIKELLPYAEWIPIPYHFSIAAGERELGRVDRAFSVRYRYELDLSGDTERRIDRRIALALALALDALQSR